MIAPQRKRAATETAVAMGSQNPAPRVTRPAIHMKAGIVKGPPAPPVCWRPLCAGVP